MAADMQQPEFISSPGLKVWPATSTRSNDRSSAMTAETTTEAEPPVPTFPHRAYGIDMTWVGEDGGMAARGHIPDLWFVAACNHLARTEAGQRNVWGNDRTTTLEDVLNEVARGWALPIDPEDSYFEWAFRYDSQITEQTPGAIPVTTLCP